MALNQTLASQWAQEVLEQEFPGLVYSITNCRSIRSCQHVPRHPSQHSHGNALDIFVRFTNNPTPDEQAALDWVEAFLDEHRKVMNVRNILWRVPGHYNHIHVDFFPKLIVAGCGSPSALWRVSLPPLWRTSAGTEFESWTPRPLYDPRAILENDMNARKQIDLIGKTNLEALRLEGRWRGVTEYYFDGRSDAELGANENLIDHLAASAQVASLVPGSGLDYGDLVKLSRP